MSKYSDMTVGSVDRCPVKYWQLCLSFAGKYAELGLVQTGRSFLCHIPICHVSTTSITIHDRKEPMWLPGGGLSLLWTPPIRVTHYHFRRLGIRSSYEMGKQAEMRLRVWWEQMRWSDWPDKLRDPRMFWLLVQVHELHFLWFCSQRMHLKKLKRARQFARAGRTNHGGKQLGTPGLDRQESNLSRIIEQATGED